MTNLRNYNSLHYLKNKWLLSYTEQNVLLLSSFFLELYKVPDQKDITSDKIYIISYAKYA